MIKIFSNSAEIFNQESALIASNKIFLKGLFINFKNGMQLKLHLNSS